eukprot:TRINITY_DN13131_c0_g1_i1.p1 TRINITY_DN13131_c0_g1~~TRINITY_DN13131_c0_g1_i1.p1  ORF type:complete len:101 (-),score=21.13 TRINITY_DN13131_c0_g1_i1:136-438(-)
MLGVFLRVKESVKDLSIPVRLAMDILQCGRDKVWLDPQRSQEIAKGTSRNAVRFLIRNGLIQRKEPLGIPFHKPPKRINFLARRAAKNKPDHIARKRANP